MLFKFLSLGSVVLLLLINIWLLFRQLNNDQCGEGSIYDLGFIKNYQEQENKPKKYTSQTLKSYSKSRIKEFETNEASVTGFNISFDLGRWDKTRLFKMYDFISIGENFLELSKKFSVCIATQSSIEKLYSIAQVSQHWSGPISVALYAAGDDEYFLVHWYVNFLKKCFSSVSLRASFHLAVPKSKIPAGTYPINLKKIESQSYQCDDYKQILKKIITFRNGETIKWRQKTPYPQNHLRNLARKNCQTEYVFLTDIDIIPSFKLAENLDVFLKSPMRKCNSKCAYVIPTYELDDRTDFPKNKSDIIRLSKKGLARPFHQKVFIYNQYATNFTR